MSSVTATPPAKPRRFRFYPDADQSALLTETGSAIRRIHNQIALRYKGLNPQKNVGLSKAKLRRHIAEWMQIPANADLAALWTPGGPLDFSIVSLWRAYQRVATGKKERPPFIPAGKDLCFRLPSFSGFLVRAGSVYLVKIRKPRPLAIEWEGLQPHNGYHPGVCTIYYCKGVWEIEFPHNPLPCPSTQGPAFI